VVRRIVSRVRGRGRGASTTENVPTPPGRVGTVQYLEEDVADEDTVAVEAPIVDTELDQSRQHEQHRALKRRVL
jgi:hypothetical protein